MPWLDLDKRSLTKMKRFERQREGTGEGTGHGTGHDSGGCGRDKGRYSRGLADSCHAIIGRATCRYLRSTRQLQLHMKNESPLLLQLITTRLYVKMYNPKSLIID